MKKHYLIVIAAAGLSLGLAGCSQSEDVAEDGQTPSTAKQTVTFVSGDETTTTRTSMGGAYTDSQFPFYWEGGDAIYVNAVQADGTTSSGISSAIEGTVDGKTDFSRQPHAIFTGTDVPALPEGGSYKVRYTGTGTYASNNQRNDVLYSFSTTSDANTLVIRPVQTISDFSKTDVSGDNYVSNIGAIGDCGTATATGSENSYKFKLDHKAAYLILMPRWEGNAGNYMLKSVTVTTRKDEDLLSGRFTFDDNGIGTPIKYTLGSCTIKIITGGSDGLPLPEAATTTDKSNGKTYRSSIIVAMKPVTDETPLYCIYEVYDNIKKETYYIEKVIGTTADGGTLANNLSFAANTVTPVMANIKGGYDAAVNNPVADGGSYLDLITNKNPYSGFYEWDVPNGEEFFVSNEMTDDYNNKPVTKNYYPNAAEGARTDWCTNSNFNALPTYDQITWYLKGGCYWQADKKWGPADNQKGGMWFKKKEKLLTDLSITEESFNTTQSGITSKMFFKGKPADFNTSDWFFLPAAGESYSGKSIEAGTKGLYWLSTPDRLSSTAFALLFNSGYAGLQKYTREFGLCLWSVR